MTVAELEEKIKNEEDIWYSFDGKTIESLYECYDIGKSYTIYEDKLMINNGDIIYLKELFNTKAEAQHYLNNGNVIRTEKLPFVTWEEFKKNEYFNFIDWKLDFIEVKKSKNGRIYIWNYSKDYLMTDFDFDEENFYKAYEVCRKLFLGEEI